MKHRYSQTTAEWVEELDKVIYMSRGWLAALPPRSEGEVLMVNAAKQLAEEACEFASSISGAIHLNHKISAYANLRPLVDRLLHATRFFEEPQNTVDWAYWSVAELNQSVNNALSQGSVNPEDHDAMRSLLQNFRQWNRTESGKERQMFKPSKYSWHKTLKAITEEANSRLRSAYDITSTYVHPTYRGPNAPDPGAGYVLEQAIWITSATIIICAGALKHAEDDWTAYQVDPYIRQLLETQFKFLTKARDDDGVFMKLLEDMNDAQMLYLYSTMLVSFVFGRDVIKGQPRLN